MHPMKVFAAAAIGWLVLFAPPAHAVNRSVFGGLAMWDSKIIKTDGLPHNDFALTYRVRPPSHPPGDDPKFATYWIVPCPNAVASYMMDPLNPGPIKLTGVYAPHVEFTGKSRVRLGDDKKPWGVNGKFRKLSAKEAFHSCSLGNPGQGVPTPIGEDAWALLIANRGGWYALEVGYERKDVPTEQWNNSDEQIATQLRVRSEDGKYEIEVTQDETVQIKGNCEAELNELLSMFDGLMAWFQSEGLSKEAYERHHERMMKLSVQIQLLKLRAMEGGACSPLQIVSLNSLSERTLGEAKRALAYLKALADADAAFWDTVYNTLVATERCLVRGTVKTFSKLLQLYPPTALLFTVGDLAVNMTTLDTKTGTGSTLMEQAVRWADVATLHATNGGKEPEGCAATFIGAVCRAATDALWNSAVLNVRLDETGRTIRGLDILNENLRPGRAHPPGTVKVMGYKGWHGLDSIRKHGTDWCEGYRQFYFSTVATVYKDFNNVNEQCKNFAGFSLPAIEGIKGLAMICSGWNRTSTGYPYGWPQPPATGSGSSVPPVGGGGMP